MKNIIQYYDMAKWAVVNGAFTPSELRDIADKIENPELRKEEEATKTEG